jgi:hypothetical protein
MLEKYQNLQTAEQRTRSKKSRNAKIMQRMSWSRDWIVVVVPTPSDFLFLLCRLSPAGVRPIVRFSLPASSPQVTREPCSEPITRDSGAILQFSPYPIPRYCVEKEMRLSRIGQEYLCGNRMERSRFNG